MGKVAKMAKKGHQRMGDSNNTAKEMDENILSRVKYRVAQPTDMFSCYELEKLSYTKEETASKNTLQYRQHHAAKFFHVAVLHEDSDEIHYDDDEDDEIIGYVCSTRYDLNSLEDINQINPLDIPKTHQPHTPTLIIHSVVVKEEYQHHGIATDMIKHYIDSLQVTNMKLEKPISKVALFAKSHLLTFFLNCGFSVICPVKKKKQEKNQQQQQQKYYLELSIQPDFRSISENIGRLVGSANNKNGSSGGGGGGKECYIVDAFAAKAGSGNPAAVVKLPPDFDPKSQSKWMQLVAAEFNLSETAFIWPCSALSSTSTGTSGSTSRDSSNHGCDVDYYEEIHWNIRYYTPTSEIPLCGHATLASASILYMTLPGNNIKESKVVFQASEDTLTMELATNATKSKSSSLTPTIPTETTLTTPSTSGSSSSSQPQQPLRIIMEFPIKPAKELTSKQDQLAVRKMLKSAFFAKFGVETLDSSILFVGISDIGDVLIELTPELFEEIGFIGNDESVNLNALVEWDGYSRGVIVCCLNPDAATKQGASDRGGGEEVGGGGTGSSGSSGGGDNQTTSSSSSSGTTSNSSSVVVVPDFYSRFFGPKAGIPEDPVTGSAHCVLGPYFSQKLNKAKIIGKQKSKRQGIVECEMTDHETVRLTGTAIPTVNGTLWM